jgi:[ribosomal protein S5]-alanine N-acetyltransferase
MTPTKKTKNETAEAMGKMIRSFGETVGEIFDDPVVKQNAKEFAESVVDATAKVIQSKVEDKEVRAKFRKVGTAAETLGKNLEEHFKTA